MGHLVTQFSAVYRSGCLAGLGGKLSFIAEERSVPSSRLCLPARAPRAVPHSFATCHLLKEMGIHSAFRKHWFSFVKAGINLLVRRGGQRLLGQVPTQLFIFFVSSTF